MSSINVQQIILHELRFVKIKKFHWSGRFALTRPGSQNAWLRHCKVVYVSIYAICFNLFCNIADDENERLNEDMAQLQQLISKEVAEKELVQRSTAELRSQMMRLEGEKIELNRILDEVRQKTLSENGSQILSDFYRNTLYIIMSFL